MSQVVASCRLNRLSCIPRVWEIMEVPWLHMVPFTPTKCSTPDPFRESCVHSSHLLRHQVWGNQSLSLRTIPAQLIISRHCLVLKSAGISPKSGAPLILSRTIWAHPVYQGNITAPSTWKAGFYEETLSFNNLAFTVPDCCTGGPSNPEAVLVNMSKAAFQIGKNSVKRYNSWNAPNKVIPFAAENALETEKSAQKTTSPPPPCICAPWAKFYQIVGFTVELLQFRGIVHFIHPWPWPRPSPPRQTLFWITLIECCVAKPSNWKNDKKKSNGTLSPLPQPWFFAGKNDGFQWFEIVQVSSFWWNSESELNSESEFQNALFSKHNIQITNTKL